MKVAFKKLTLLIFHRDRKPITEMLQHLGVVHLETDNQIRSKDVEKLERKKANLKKAIEVLKEYKKKKSNIESDQEVSIKPLLNKVLDLKHRTEVNIQQREIIRKEMLHLIPWGDFDIKKVQKLMEHGLHVSFCIATRKDSEGFDFSSFTFQVIHESADNIYFVVIGKGDLSLPFETIKLPDTTLSEVMLEENQIAEDDKRVHKELKALSHHLPLFQRELVKIENKLSLAVAEESFRKYGEGSILSLSGWFPAGMEEKLVEYLKKQKLTYSVEDPAPESKVPTLLKNEKYSKLFEPITKIFELPNYNELDLTPLIAVFYPIMFAYCLGDAGYGLVFLAASIIGWFTFLKNERRLAILGVILGLFTTLMGIVKSGSVFGMPTDVSNSWILFDYLRKYIIIPDDRTFVFNAFNVALMIGVVQIFTGIILSIVNKIRFDSVLSALPQVGKLLIVSGLIWSFLADMQGVEILQPFPLLRKVFLVSGVLMVIFFHDMSQSIISRAASGLLPLFFIITGILGDVLSYVRLFALGVASSVLGLVVNQIGSQIMENGWWGIVVGVLFLIIGHTLNFFIAILGAFVHPLRLTFVEFYNNAQFKGGGIEYRPFRKEKLDMKN